MRPETEYLAWPHHPIACAARSDTCEHGHVDQVGPALKALRDAEAGVTAAQERARRIVSDARAKVADARTVLAAAIVDEYLDGARVSDLAIRADHNRETIRRILRAADVEAE